MSNQKLPTFPHITDKVEEALRGLNGEVWVRNGDFILVKAGEDGLMLTGGCCNRRVTLNGAVVQVMHDLCMMQKEGYEMLASMAKQLDVHLVSFITERAIETRRVNGIFFASRSNASRHMEFKMPSWLRC